MRFGQHPGPDVELSMAIAHIWDWFWQLNGRRQSGQSGSQPLTHAEIKSWAELTDTDITPAEVRALIAMDDAFLVVCSDELQGMRARAEDANNVPKSKVKS